jgi:hypothetical protein
MSFTSRRRHKPSSTVILAASIGSFSSDLVDDLRSPDATVSTSRRGGGLRMEEKDTLPTESTFINECLSPPDRDFEGNSFIDTGEKLIFC